ncbi:MAG: chalcone isomerase family protein [Bacteriovorax sp.]|nr:chalcone isomerase family protein [Bacteriovorax sp.]
MKKMIGFILLAISLNLTAATLDAVTFADSANVDGKELILNGVGIRKATFLKIKVYYGALYLEQKSKDANSFLASASPKQIVMHFVREVDAKKLRDAFVEGMEAANKNHASFKTQLDKLNSFIPDVVKDDLIIITFSNDGVSLNVKGKPTEKITGSEFSHALLNIWFINPRDENLRNGLLGL